MAKTWHPAPARAGYSPGAEIKDVDRRRYLLVAPLRRGHSWSVVEKRHHSQLVEGEAPTMDQAKRAAERALRDLNPVREVSVLAGREVEQQLPPQGTMDGVFRVGSKVRIHPAAIELLRASGLPADPTATLKIVEIIPREQNRKADAEAAVVSGHGFRRMMIEVDMLVPAGLRNPDSPETLEAVGRGIVTLGLTVVGTVGFVMGRRALSKPKRTGT